MNRLLSAFDAPYLVVRIHPSLLRHYLRKNSFKFFRIPLDIVL